MVELPARSDAVPAGVEDILHATDPRRLHELSFRDARVVPCASIAGCAVLLIEDLLHGRFLDGDRIEDRFRS